jgi:hypothetical protein
MEIAPEEWGVFPAEEFNTAAPRASGQLYMDLTTMAVSHDVIIIDQDSGEPVASEAVLDAIKASGSGAAVRFAVIVGEDQSVHLQLQGLPAAASVLMGKPAFRG